MIWKSVFLSLKPTQPEKYKESILEKDKIIEKNK